MLHEKDPMRGMFDRMIQTHDVRFIRGFLALACRFVGKSLEEYKNHCVAQGYGSPETMELLCSSS